MVSGLETVTLSFSIDVLLLMKQLSARYNEVNLVTWKSTSSSFRIFMLNREHRLHTQIEKWPIQKVFILVADACIGNSLHVLTAKQIYLIQETVSRL